MNVNRSWQWMSIFVSLVIFQACDDDSSKKSQQETPDCSKLDMVLCKDICIDPMTDNTFCGADAECANYSDCAAQGKMCEKGVCIDGTPANECSPGLVKCGGVCIDPLTDNNFCGATAQCQAFTACFDGQVCVGGTCCDKTEENCPDGLVKCGEACIDPQTNKSFCGADASCTKYMDCAAENKTCEFGACVGNGCAPGMSKCGDDCIDPMTDNNFCGADDLCMSFATCVDGQVCVGGLCSIKTEENCPEGMVKCGEACIDPMTNKSYCGADATCASYSNCAADGKTCEAGVCVGGTLNDCEPGKVKCGDECVDPQTDGRYCGAYEDCSGYIVCTGSQKCESGSCSDIPNTGECDPGLVMCGGECINPDIDDQYCGANADCSDYITCSGSYKCEKATCIDTMPLELIMKAQTIEVVENDNLELSLSLNRAPENDITVALSLEPEATDDIKLSVDKITFSPYDWQDHIFHVLTKQDYKKTGDMKLTVRAAVDKLSSEQEILYKDIDVCGLVYTVDNQVTSENGTTASVSVHLTCIPDSNIIYTISSDNPNEGTIQAPTDHQLVFTPENWNAPQSITVVGVDDSSIDGAQKYHILLKPDASNPGDFKSEYSIEFVNNDNDVPGIHANDIFIKEGSADEVNISISTKPSSNVVVKADALPTGLELVGTTELHFTPDNYMTPQALVIHAVDNDIVDGNRNLTVHFTAESADSDYNHFGTDIQVAVEDDDKAGIVITNGASLDSTQVNENGQVSSCFALTSKPTQNVTINISLENAVAGTKVAKSQYTFTPDNWNQCQRLEINIGRDGIVNSSAILSTVNFKGSSSDTNYTGTLKTGSVSITNIDAYKMIIRSDYVTTISEDDSKNYDICMKLDAKPSSTVTVKPTSSNKNELQVSSAISFNSTNWNEWKCISYTSVDDNKVDGDQKVYITLALSSSDAGFNGLSYKSNAITVVDNEKPAIVVRESTTAAQDCTKGGSVTYYLRLANQPSGNVTVSARLEEYKAKLVDYTKHAGISLSPASLQFTSSNYNTEQSIVVKCSENGNAFYNYLKTYVVFSSTSSAYWASEVKKIFTSYPIGREKTWEYTGAEKGPIYLPRGEYKFTINGAQGGGNDDHGGYGGQVIANVRIESYRVEQSAMYVLVGGKGGRGPTSASAENNSGGWGIASGGNGDWGINNWSYGGGGASGIQMRGGDYIYYVMAAGGGGGGTAKWKDASGWGGKGGCAVDNDPQCRGRDANYNYFSKGNRSTNNGEPSPKGDEKGGGGGGLRGGLAGSRSQVGGHGGTSGTAETTDRFTLISRTITPGVKQGNGSVTITIIPSDY
ncbi:MAG: hypothetical protein J6A01_09260 [Proteobacteria bacterium]|nr:hypothetical protein [Pseudomonadota bacterium]